MKLNFNSATIKLCLRIVDFLIINFIYVALFFLISLFDQSIVNNSTYKLWLIANISYLISIGFIPIVHHSRIIRYDIIISRVAKTFALQLMFFFALLGVLGLNMPNFWYLLIFFFSTFCGIIFFQIYVNRYLKKSRFYIKKYCKVILIGSDDNIMEIANTFLHPWSGYNCIGYFADKKYNVDIKGMRYMGNVSDAHKWMEQNEVDQVYCGLPSTYANEIMSIVNYCENNLIRYYSVPNLQNYLKRKMVVRKVENTLVLAIRDEPLSFFSNRLVKRSFDILVSSVFLITLYPIIYVVLGIFIKLSSPGPVYFKQQRTGIDGKTFVCIKFRSMKVNLDSDRLQTTKYDGRKTKIGNFIRKTNLDELPQFINVWKGEMSIVGPRPHMLKHTNDYSHLINKYMVRHLVKPGITGWAQVRGHRGETKNVSEMEKRVRCDIWYLENWSFWLDLDIIFKTLYNAIKGESNAY